MDGMNRDWEIIFIDDCSPDDSWDVLTKLRGKYQPRLRTIRLLVNGVADIDDLVAGGIDNFQRLRPSLRVGFDFRYDYYKRNRR